MSEEQPAEFADDVKAAVRHLERVFRYRIEAGEQMERDDVVRIAYVQLLRAGLAGARLNEHGRKLLRKQLNAFVQEVHDATRLVELRPFLLRASRAASELAPPPGKHARDRVTPQASLERLIQREIGRSKDSDDVVRRAVLSAIRRRRAAMRGQRQVLVEPEDPMRDLLDLRPEGEVVLPYSDVRAQLMRGETERLRGLNAAYRAGRIDEKTYAKRKEALKTSGFVGLLRQAAIFSDQRLREAMGDELWGLCRPVGFSDSRQRTLLVEVSSAALAQEISMRKTELLSRLRQLPGFERLRDVRFSVVPHQALPILGKRPPRAGSGDKR